MGQSQSLEDTTPHFSSFNGVSNELLVQVFAQIQSVGAKMRLGRVCRRFHQCLQLYQSWRFNTELDVSHTSIEASLALITHSPRFNSFKINLPKPPHKKLHSLLDALQAQTHKFNLSVLDVRVCGRSAALESFLLLVAAESHPFLKVLHLRSAHSDHLAISLIQHSDSLSFVSLNMDAYEDYRTVLAALHNKPLTGLMLSSCLPVPPFPIHPGPLAAVINTARGHSLRVLALFNCQLHEDFEHFFFLVPEAARAITHLVCSSLHGSTHAFYGLFLWASLLPNLDTMSFTQVHSTTRFEKLDYSCAIILFLFRPTANRPRLEFRVQRVRGSCIAERLRSSSKDWWNEIHRWFMTQAEGITDKDHWFVTLQRGNENAMITYDKD